MLKIDEHLKFLLLTQTLYLSIFLNRLNNPIYQYSILFSIMRI